MNVMNFFHNLTLKNRLTLSYGAVLFLVLLSSICTILLISSAHNKVEEKDGLAEQTILVREYQLHVANIWQFVTDASLTRDYGVLNEALEEKNLAEAARDKILALQSNKKDKSEFDHLSEILNNFYDVGKKMYAAYGEGTEQGSVVMAELDELGAQLLKEINPLVKQHLDDNLALTNEISSYFANIPY